jgi:hypothetical protein
MPYRTILVSRVPRVRCATHGVRQVVVPWAEERSRFAALFETWTIRLLQESTIQGVATEWLGLRAVVMDMRDQNSAAVRDHVPHGLSKIVFDRYHVIARLTAAVSDVRRAEQRELQQAGEMARAAELKGRRFTLVRGKATRTAEDEAEIRALHRAGFKAGRAGAIREAVPTPSGSAPRPERRSPCSTRGTAGPFAPGWHRSGGPHA